MEYIHQVVSIPFARNDWCYHYHWNMLSYLLSFSAIKSWILKKILNFDTSQPMEMVVLDFFSLADGRGGVANVLVLIISPNMLWLSPPPIGQPGLQLGPYSRLSSLVTVSHPEFILTNETSKTRSSRNCAVLLESRRAIQLPTTQWERVALNVLIARSLIWWGPLRETKNVIGKDLFPS